MDFLISLGIKNHQLLNANSLEEENHLWHETTAAPNPPKSKTTATTTPPDETTRPPPSHPKEDSTKHPRQEYAYNPHLPPILRFDETGDADQIPELLQLAQQRPLSDDEIKLLADALKNCTPWLEWAGKQEAKSFAVDPVALHIHERLSAKAILRVAARQDVQRHLFADPQQEYHKAVQFYEHDVDWSNRLILGDSLTVMSSLAHREDLAGKVQMIYIDPPYGIKFASNFQPTVFQRDVKDKESDLTREREQIKAYRDTWTLGVHSYLAYLRDRLIVAKDLLSDSASIFVQINDVNVHRVRCLMDEVFERDNFVSMISYTTTSGLGNKNLETTGDYLIWYCKDISKIKTRAIWLEKELKPDTAYRYLELKHGARRYMSNSELNAGSNFLGQCRLFRHDNLQSQSGGESGQFPVEYEGQRFTITRGSWKTSKTGMDTLIQSGRISRFGNTLSYVRYIDDFPCKRLTNMWTDTSIAGFASNKKYVVETNPKVVQRCILMTTDPGDLVLDPTCGSGTTAYVAEGWGRRWITIDTSRVAVALARQTPFNRQL